MAHGLNAMLKRGGPSSGGTLGGCKSDGKTTGIGSRRIFAPQFKLQVLDSYRNDADCKGNQRATARKYGIHRRQIQKWLQVEGNLRNSVLKGGNNNNNNSITSSNNNNSAANSNNVISNNVSANNNNSASVSGGVSELIVCPEATSGSRKCGLAVALRSGAESGRQQDDSSVVPVQSGSVSGTEIDVHQRNTTSAVVAGGIVVAVAEDRGKHLVVDKRVPDIPHNNNIYQQQQPPQYEWHHYQMRRSPDTASSTTGSCYSDLGDSSPALVACSDGQCDCTNTSSAASSTSLSELCLPLDYTMHTRTSLHGDTTTSVSTPVAHSSPPPPPQYPLVTSMCSPVPPTPSPPPCQCSAAPIDLTVRRRPQPAYASYTIHTTLTPVPVIATVPPAPNTSPLPSPNATTAAAAHIWDLSTGRGGVKRAHDQDTTSTTTAAAAAAAASAPNSLQERPVKLFKPYLDHVSDEDDECDMKRNQPPVIISSSHYDTTEYFYNNNNNNGDYKLDYSLLYKDESNSGGGGGGGTPYYCPLNDYYPNGGRLQYTVAQDLVVHHSPFVFSKGNNNNIISAGLNSIKQRQSYSLDFKLSAIECYYRDAVCRGNQRAVASKFKIHRRQVQKWLKQEHQLRQRNETMKPLHIVR